MTLKELRAKNAKLLADARAKFDQIKSDTSDERAAEIESEYDAMMAEYDERQKQIDRLAGLEEREARAASAEEVEERRAREGNRPTLGDAAARGAGEEGGEAPREYRSIFEDAMRFGVNALSNEERQILAENNIVLSPEQRANLATTDGATGGYTVPEGFSGEIDKALALWGPMLDAGVARQYPTSTGAPIPWPTLDYTGARGELKAENAAASDDGGQDPAFGQKVMNAYLYDSEIVRVSLELLNDSAFNMEGLLNELFAESLGRTGNAVLTTGDGNSKPQGILTGAAEGIAAAGAAAIAPDELFDMQHSVDPAYRASPMCKWQFNDNTLNAIRKLKDGDGNYLWQMGDVRTGEPNTLLGKSYKINQAMPDMAAGQSPILFGDHSRYVVRKVGGMSMLALRERYAEHLQVGFIAYMRFDGRLLRPAAVKKLTMAAA